MKVPPLFLFWLIPSTAFAAQAGLVVGTESGQLRRVIVADSDKDLHEKDWIGPGETLIYIDQADEITAKMRRWTGKEPIQPLAAILDKNSVVIAVIVADPLLDKTPEGELVAAFPGVQAGYIFDRKRQVFIVPAGEVETTVDVGDQTIDEVVLVPEHDLAPLPLLPLPQSRLVAR